MEERNCLLQALISFTDINIEDGADETMTKVQKMEKLQKESLELSEQILDLQKKLAEKNAEMITLCKSE